MVIKLHNLKILLSLLLLSHSTISNFYQFTNWNFWGLVIPLNFVLEIARNYVSIIITNISNITVFVSHNVLCFRYFMPISHCINKKAPPTHCMYWGLSPSLKNIIPSFLPNTLLNLQPAQAPISRQYTLNILIFHALP